MSDLTRLFVLEIVLALNSHAYRGSNVCCPNGGIHEAPSCGVGVTARRVATCTGYGYILRLNTVLINMNVGVGDPIVVVVRVQWVLTLLAFECLHCCGLATMQCLCLCKAKNSNSEKNSNSAVILTGIVVTYSYNLYTRGKKFLKKTSFRVRMELK